MHIAEVCSAKKARKMMDNIMRIVNLYIVTILMKMVQ